MSLSTPVAAWRAMPLKLVRAVGEEGDRWSAGTWGAAQIERHLLGAIAVAVQRGNALALLSGYTQTTSMRARRLGWAGKRSEEGRQGRARSERAVRSCCVRVWGRQGSCESGTWSCPTCSV